MAIRDAFEAATQRIASADLTARFVDRGGRTAAHVGWFPMTCAAVVQDAGSPWTLIQHHAGSVSM